MEKAQLSEKLAQVANRYGIRLALLFGSAVSGRMHDRSDLDVAILFNASDLSFGQLVELQHELQTVAGDMKVDLSLLNRADPLFLKRITESCSLLYGDERDLQRLRIYAFRRYQDHRRFLKMERECARQFIREVGGPS